MWGSCGRRETAFDQPDFGASGVGYSKQSTLIIAGAGGGRRQQD
jgi:hypothetical protein